MLPLAKLTAFRKPKHAVETGSGRFSIRAGEGLSLLTLPADVFLCRDTRPPDQVVRSELDARSVVARAVLDAVGAKSDWVDLTWEGEGQGWDLVNLWLCAKPESLPASESLLWFQVKGLPVFTSDGRNVGTIVDYEETGAHGIFGVRTPQGSDVLLPVAPSHVVVDIQAGRVTALQWDEMVAAAGADVPPDDEDTE